MQAETLDVLEKAEIPAQQARAIARAIDIEIAASRHSLATRADMLLESALHRTALSELKGSLETRIEASKNEILNRMYGALLAQLAVLLGLAYFFVNRLA
jgi:hypothetical protein